jgi:hypothetical protein
MCYSLRLDSPTKASPHAPSGKGANTQPSSRPNYERRLSDSFTLSQEALELLADPDATMTVTRPAPEGATGHVHYDPEVCDPTQGDSH